MKYFTLIWKNMTRKKVRATFTLLSIVVAFTLYGMLTALALVFSGEYRFGDDDRLFIVAKYGGTLPLSYVDRIRSVEGIVPERLVYGSNMAGYYQDEQALFSFQPRSPDTTVQSLRAGDRYRINLEQMENWARTRNGVLVQEELAEEYGLEVGDNMPIVTPFFTKNDGTNVWELVVSGIYGYTDPDENPREALFHYDYFDEARTENKGTVNTIVNVIESPDMADRIGREIDAMFANSAYETRTGTEESLTRDFMRRVGNMGFTIYLILGAVFLTMILVTANTMIQAFRERIHEIGILKTLGFSGSTVLGLILAESLLVLLIGGGAGLAIAWYIIEVAKEQITAMFYLPPDDMAIGVVIMVVTGIVVGIMPALQARRLTITEALGRS